MTDSLKVGDKLIDKYGTASYKKNPDNWRVVLAIFKDLDGETLVVTQWDYINKNKRSWQVHMNRIEFLEKYYEKIEQDHC